VGSYQAGKLGVAGQTGQKLSLPGGSLSLHRPAGMDTTEPFQALPLFLPGKPGNIRTQPRFPFFNLSVVFGFFAILRFAKTAFLE
jgi:hypothetical protein